MRKLLIFALLLCASSAIAQTKHGRIQSEGQSTFDEFSNTRTVALVGATPSIAGGNVFRTANGVTTTITNFVGGTDSQEITVVCGETLTTIQNNVNIVISTGADFPCISVGLTAKFVYSLTDGKWFQISGGGGGGSITPPGSNGDLPLKNGSLFGASHINDSGSIVSITLPTSLSGTLTVAGTANINGDFHPKGPNPYTDPTAYGMRPIAPGFIPAVPGITGAIATGTNALTISTTNCPLQTVTTCFVAGDGIVVVGGGPPQSMAIVTPPTVTPRLAAGPTGTTVTVAAPAGSTTYNYKFVAVDQGRGMTVPSAAVSTTTGNANLGARSANITSCARSGVTVTCLTAVHELAVGASVIINQASDGTFSGTYIVATVPDNTHFTYTSGFDINAGATTSSTGGIVHWFNENLVSWAHVPGAHQYIICSDRGGAGFVPIGISLPDNNTITDMALSFDDLGSPLRDNFSVPYWATNACTASSPQNDELVTTIVSGPPTANLVLANTAGATVATAVVLHDNGPGALAAATVSRQAPLNIPWIAGQSYVFNSYLTLPALTNICQLGGVVLNDTVQLVSGGRWSGNCPSMNGSVPSSGAQGFASIATGPAYPGFYQASGSVSVDAIQWTSAVGTNNKIFMVTDASGVPSGTLGNMNFTIPGSMSIGLILRGNLNSISPNGVTMRGQFLFSSPTTSIGDTTTPGFYLDPAGIFADNIQLAGRGVVFKSAAQPFNGVETIKTIYMNGGITPLVTMVSGGANLFLHVGVATIDTVGQPLFANLNSTGSKLTVDDLASGPNSDGVSRPPLVSGYGTPVIGPSAGVGYARNLGNQSGTGLVNGIFATGTPLTQQFIEGDFWAGTQHSIFINSPAPAAPTSSGPTSGGSVPVGNITYKVVPVWQNGGEGNYSPASAVFVTDSGNRTIALSWTAVPGNPLGYNIYRNSALLSCTIPATTTNSYVDIAGSACGQSEEQIPTGGPTMLMSGTKGIAAPLFTGGGFKSIPTSTKTSAYTPACNDNIIPIDASGGAFNISLNPALIGCHWVIERLDNTSGNAVSLVPLSGTIDGLANVPIPVRTTINANCGGTNCSVESRSIGTTSAQLAALLSDETGTGLAVFGTSPALVTPTVSTSLTINSGGELDITTSGGKVGIKAPASVSSDHIWALPDHDSTGTQCISSNGSHILSFSACSGGTGTPGGSDTNVQYRSGGTFTGSPAFTYDGTSTVSIGDTSGGALGHLAMKGSVSGTVTIQSQTTAGTPTLTLPNTSGTFAATATAPITIDAITGTVACLSCATASGALAANQLLIGQSGNVAAALGSLGTTTTVLHGNASGAPSFGSVSLTADVSGALGYANGGTAQTSRQPAINSLLGATTRGQIFVVDASLNVVPLTLGSNGSCLTATATDPAWGSCATGAVSGTAATGQVTTWGSASSITGNSNFTYSANLLTLFQGSNGASTQVWKRFTDASPTGNAWEVRNAAGTAIANMDVNGNLTAVSLTTTGPCNGGTAGCAIFQQGTAPTITATGAATLYGPTSITDYRMALPAGPGTGVLRGSNSSGTVTLSFVSASGVGPCTNQVMTAVNDNAAPSCGPVVGPMFGTQAANLVLAGPTTGSAAFPTFRTLVSADVPPINLNTNGANGGVTAILPFINGGCNASSASACFNGITPMTTAGDLEYEVSAGVAGRLAAGTSSQVLIGGIAPSWGALNLASMTTGTLGIGSGGSGQVTANAALNAFLPSQGGNAGNCLGTNGTNSSWTACGGVAGVTPHPNFGTSFSSQTSVTIAGSSHLMGTKNLGVFCYDNASPANALIPANWTVNSSTFDVIVTFAASQSGYCVVNGSGPNRYATSFSGVTTVTVTGATHALATADLEVTVWDNSSPRKKIIPAEVTVDTSTFDVVVTFANSQSGRVVIQ